jgi:hypothetical protein
MDWYTLEFPSQIAPFAEPLTFIDEAQRIYEEANCPSGFAVFQEIKGDGKLFLYFSPSTDNYCAKIFQSYRAITCVQPTRSDRTIIWVAGDTSVELNWL